MLWRWKCWAEWMALQVDPSPPCSDDIWGCSGSVHTQILISCTPLAPRVESPPAAFNSKHISHPLGQGRGLCLLYLQSSLQSGIYWFVSLSSFVPIMLGLQWLIYTEDIISKKNLNLSKSLSWPDLAVFSHRIRVGGVFKEMIQRPLKYGCCV